MAAKTIGSSTKTILLEHLIPNAMGSILVTVTHADPVRYFYGSISGLSGHRSAAAACQPWNHVQRCNSRTFRTCPHQLFIPALVICLIMFGFNFVGDGLRDALDPKLKK